MGFGIDFVRNSVFFTKNGNLMYETTETFSGHPRAYIGEKLINIKTLYPTISLKNHQVNINTGSHPFQFDLLGHQQQQHAQRSFKPYYELSKLISTNSI